MTKIGRKLIVCCCHALVGLLLLNSFLGAEEPTSTPSPTNSPPLETRSEPSSPLPDIHSPQASESDAQSSTDSLPVTNTEPSPDSDQEESRSSEPTNYIKLTGKIWRVKSGFVFARTPVGTLTLFSKQGLKSVKGGQRVTLWTYDRNVVVDIHTKKDPTPIKRFITGIPSSVQPDGPPRLWTPEGDFFLSPESHKENLARLKEGEPITVQLNKNREIVGHPDLNIDIQISNGTSQRPGAKMKVDGTVRRVKAGFAFVETPIGILLLSKKIGFKNPKKGQSVTVWLDEENLVIDVRQKDEDVPSHRFITSKIVYASDNKKEIKVWTPEGEKTLTLPATKKRRRSFKPGTPITIQFNKEGEIIEVWKAS